MTILDDIKLKITEAEQTFTGLKTRSQEVTQQLIDAQAAVDEASAQLDRAKTILANTAAVKGAVDATIADFDSKLSADINSMLLIGKPTSGIMSSLGF